MAGVKFVLVSYLILPWILQASYEWEDSIKGNILAARHGWRNPISSYVHDVLDYLDIERSDQRVDDYFLTADQESPEGTDTPDIAEPIVHEPRDPPDVAQVTEFPERTEEPEIPESTDPPEAPEVTELPETPNGTDTPDLPDVFNGPDVIEPPHMSLPSTGP